MGQTLELPLEAIRAYCETQPIQRLALFGSALRGEMHATSDVDLLVEYEAGALITFLDMEAQQRALSELIGLQVDLRTAEELHHSFRPRILAEMQTIYARN